MQTIIPTFSITSEELDPKEYLKLLEENKLDISSVEIVPPKLGQMDFGKLKVNYKYPIFKSFSFGNK